MEKSNLSRLESGRSNPTYFTLYKIAFYLEVPISELTHLTEEKENK
ncbi:helix-turn-helix domain-containing protein [Flavobacteriales bacterium]|nr:helix-turn-helix domain-containing protein [Flavobacteriales bacterium]